MKNIQILIVALAAFALGSCSDFLDLKHESNISADNFNKNTEELYASLVGCYNGMQEALYREWAMTELRSDNTRIYARTSTTAIFDVIRQLDLSTIQPINYLVDEYWAGNYHNIERCNTVIRDFAVVDDPDLRAQYKAEAMFIRSYHYFNLVRLFGGVFLVTKPITANEARYMQRSNPEAIYDLIMNDLKEIVENDMLPDVRSGEELGRITLPAAKALLAKVYMTRYLVGSDEYAKAKPLLEEVITAAGNPQSASDLVPFADIFNITNEMNKEIIFDTLQGGQPRYRIAVRQRIRPGKQRDQRYKRLWKIIQLPVHKHHKRIRCQSERQAQGCFARRKVLQRTEQHMGRRRRNHTVPFRKEIPLARRDRQ